MPHTLTAPIVTAQGTAFKLSEFHVEEIEVPAASTPRVRGIFQLIDGAGDVIPGHARVWNCADFAAFQNEANNVQTGTTFQRMRKAVIARAVAEGTIPAGVVS